MDSTLKNELSRWADEFVTWLEVTESTKTCLCDWIDSGRVHPESGRRLLSRSSQHPECPQHTKRGLIMGYLLWAENKGLELTTVDRMIACIMEDTGESEEIAREMVEAVRCCNQENEIGEEEEARFSEADVNAIADAEVPIDKLRELLSNDSNQP